MGFLTGQLHIAGTADMDALGNFTCASTTGVYPGQEGWLTAATKPSVRVIVVSVAATKIALKAFDARGPEAENGNPDSTAGFPSGRNYGTTNFGAGYTLANSVTLDFETQVVPGRTSP